jgi:hypothetical protein
MLGWVRGHRSAGWLLALFAATNVLQITRCGVQGRATIQDARGTVEVEARAPETRSKARAPETRSKAKQT